MLRDSVVDKIREDINETFIQYACIHVKQFCIICKVIIPALHRDLICSLYSPRKYDHFMFIGHQVHALLDRVRYEGFDGTRLRDEIYQIRRNICDEYLRDAGLDIERCLDVKVDRPGTNNIASGVNFDSTDRESLESDSAVSYGICGRGIYEFTNDIERRRVVPVVVENLIGGGAYSAAFGANQVATALGISILGDA